jgi:2'-5' RNA ligase
VRLFIATLLSDANQRHYADHVRHLLQHHDALLRPVPDDSAHITYAFGGHVPAASFDELTRLVDEIAAGAAAFDVTLGTPHVLFAGREARLLCADVTDGAVAVRELTDRIASTLGARSGDDWNASRAPHVTVARFRRGVRRRDAGAVTTMIDRAGETSRADVVDRIQVIESELTPSGARYQVRHVAPLVT